MRDPFQLPPFAKLRGTMAEHAETSERLGSFIGLSRKQIDVRLNLHQPFTLDEIHAIMEHYEIPGTMMHEYFPKNGGIKPRGRAA